MGPPGARKFSRPGSGGVGRRRRRTHPLRQWRDVGCPRRRCCRGISGRTAARGGIAKPGIARLQIGRCGGRVRFRPSRGGAPGRPPPDGGPMAGRPAPAVPARQSAAGPRCNGAGAPGGNLPTASMAGRCGLPLGRARIGEGPCRHDRRERGWQPVARSVRNMDRRPRLDPVSEKQDMPTIPTQQPRNPVTGSRGLRLSGTNGRQGRADGRHVSPHLAPEGRRQSGAAASRCRVPFRPVRRLCPRRARSVVTGEAPPLRRNAPSRIRPRSAAPALTRAGAGCNRVSRCLPRRQVGPPKPKRWSRWGDASCAIRLRCYLIVMSEAPGGRGRIAANRFGDASRATPSGTDPCPWSLPVPRPHPGPAHETNGLIVGTREHLQWSPRMRNKGA